MNIVELTTTDADFLVLKTLLHRVRLDEILSRPGPFTVFAPTNGGFGSYDLNSLLNPLNHRKLQKILSYHVVKGELQPRNFTNGQLIKTLSGDLLEASVVHDPSDWQHNGIYVGAPHANSRDVSHDAKITGYLGPNRIARPTNASNGVIYPIGKVLLPPNTTTPRIPQPHPDYPWSRSCTKKSCPWSTVTHPSQGFACCLQVDAAPRMPADIFNDTAALAEYKEILQQVSSIVGGRGSLVNAPCPGTPYATPHHHTTPQPHHHTTTPQPPTTPHAQVRIITKTAQSRLIGLKGLSRGVWLAAAVVGSSTLVKTCPTTQPHTHTAVSAVQSTMHLTMCKSLRVRDRKGGRHVPSRHTNIRRMKS